jgi:hypothetical protein
MIDQGIPYSWTLSLEKWRAALPRKSFLSEEPAFNT